jgi:hypothetical protein
VKWIDRGLTAHGCNIVVPVEIIANSLVQNLAGLFMFQDLQWFHQNSFVKADPALSTLAIGLYATGLALGGAACIILALAPDQEESGEEEGEYQRFEAVAITPQAPSSLQAPRRRSTR